MLRWKPTGKKTKVTVGIPHFVSYEQIKEYEPADGSAEDVEPRGSISPQRWALTELNQSRATDGAPLLALRFVDRSHQIPSGDVFAVVTNSAGQPVQVLQTRASTGSDGIAPVMFTFSHLPLGKHTAKIFVLSQVKRPISAPVVVTL